MHAGRLLRPRRHRCSARDNAARAVNLIEPTLDAWGVPYFPIESPDDLPVRFAQAYETSLEHSGPSVVLVGRSDELRPMLRKEAAAALLVAEG